jgi:LysM repeat protein/ribosomal 30S subunit maturation factor RimM
MTNSFQSTAFQSATSPVDTFVQPVTVQPKSSIEELAEILQAVNPGIQTFLDSRIKNKIAEEEQEGTELAIEDAAKQFKNISRSVKKTDGEKAARQLIGGSIFADRAYQRTKAEILGNNLKSTLSNSYATTQVDGKPLNTFSLQSPQFQTWLEGERSRVVDQLGDINPTYVNKYFLPKLADATANVTSSHIEQHQEFQLEKLKNLAVPLVKGIIVSDDETDLQLISNFEQSMNDLGLVTKDRSDINKTLVGVLLDQAEAVGLSGGGDMDGATRILDIAKQFPYGVDGNLNLTAHPDYQNKVNSLKKSINNYIYEYENRKDVERKRIQREDTITQLKQFAETGDAEIITNLIKKYPLDATKISTSGVAIDGNTLERSAQLETNMIGGYFESSKEASIAALQWYQDPRTPKTVQNRNRLTQLLDTAESVERGDYTEINKGLTELSTQLRGEFSSPNFITSLTGQLNDKGSRKVTDFYNAAKLELYQYRLSEEGRNANTLQIIEKIESVKEKYILKARELNPPLNIESGVSDEKKGNDMSDIEGDANSNLEAGFFSDDETPTTVTVELGDTLTQIAEQFGVPLQALIEANNITNPDLIEEGDELIVPTIGEAPPVISSGSKQQAIVSAANELGVRPEDLAAVISQETMGTFDPQIIGGEGNNYKGLIQFGIPERKAYGYRDGMSFEEQLLGPVVRYLKDRGVKRGHGVKELYAAILTGNVSTLDTDGLTRKDSFGTSVESALPELNKGGSHYNNALDFLSEQGKFKQNSN